MIAKAKTKIRLEDLARIAGVSIATVSRALNDSPVVKRITKRRVWNIAVEHNYIDARQLPVDADLSACTLGIFISSGQDHGGLLFNPFYQQIIASVGQAARQQGCDLLLSRLSPRNETDLNLMMEKTRVDGAIFIGQSHLHDRFNQLAQLNDNFIVWGQGMPGQRYRTIGSDNLAGGVRATEHLLKLGRRRIVYLGEIEGMELRYRFHGYLKALEAEGLAFDPQFAVTTVSESHAADAALTAFLNTGAAFDGIFAASDAIAFGAMTAMQRAGLTVPGDVAIVGYDDTPFAEGSRPRLTTISQDLVLAGQRMVSKLVGSSVGETALAEFVSTRLVVRESCGATTAAIAPV